MKPFCLVALFLLVGCGANDIKTYEIDFVGNNVIRGDCMIYANEMLVLSIKKGETKTREYKDGTILEAYYTTNYGVDKKEAHDVADDYVWLIGR